MNAQPTNGHYRNGNSRVLPHNLDAEASILGGIIVHNEVLDHLDTLEIEHFYHHQHRVVFEAVRNLQVRNTPIDVVTLEAEIQRRGKLDAIGGIAFFGELALRVPTVDNVVSYAKTVRDLALVRNVIIKAAAHVERGYRWQDEADEFVSEILADLEQLDRQYRASDRRCPLGGKRLRDTLPVIQRNRDLPVFKTGLAQVDDAAPLMGGHLVVVIGGSGSGKSTFTLQIARHHADTLGPTLLVSLELAGEEVAARIVSRECNVSWFAALRGVVSDGVMTRILDHDRIRIVDDFSVTPAHIRSHVLALQREFPGQLVLVVIDYVQILDAQGRDERERIKRAMEGLRTLAKELGVVFMLVSQSSRDGAKALRSGNAVGTEASATGAESSQIERAAYVTFSLGEMTESANLDGPVVVDLSIGKTRFGRGDLVVPLEYDGRRGSWAEAGNVVTATRHKVNRAEKKKGQDAALVAHATADLLLRSDGPMSIADLRQQLHVKNAVMSEAVKQLLAESPLRVTRVKGKKAGGWWPLWSVSKAIERGVDLVPTGGP